MGRCDPDFSLLSKPLAHAADVNRGEETTPRECEDDVDSETEDLKKKLRSFKKSGWWSESDDEHFSSDNDESDDSLSAEVITIIVGKKSEMKEANETDEDWDDEFWSALGKASQQECVELTQSHQNNDQITFYMITDDSLGSGKEQD